MDQEKKLGTSPEIRQAFFRSVPSLLSQQDVHGQSPQIVRVGAIDLTISSIDPQGKTVRNAYYSPKGEEFELVDTEHIYDPLEGIVLKEGVLCRVGRTS